MKMKRNLLISMLALILVFVLLPVAALAAEAETPTSGTFGDGFTWTLDSDGTLTIDGEGDMEDFQVTTAGTFTPWVDVEDQIQKVIISDGITSIGDYAFYYCKSLQTAVLPEGLTHIGQWAFYQCSALTSVNLPDSITEIENAAFYWCSKLTSIHIPERLTTIYAHTFCGCSSLTRVILPATVSNIYNYAFSACSKLEQILFCGTKEQYDTLVSNMAGHSKWNYSASVSSISFHNYVNSVCTNCGDECEHTYSEGICSLCGVSHEDHIMNSDKVCTVCGFYCKTADDHNYTNGFCVFCDAYQPAEENEEGVYEIGNAGQLYWFAALVNGTLDGVEQNVAANAVLVQDITVNESLLTDKITVAQDRTATVNEGAAVREWIPIGAWGDNYTPVVLKVIYEGTFDGANHTVSGLYFNNSAISQISLIGDTVGVTKNVKVADSYFYGNNNIGGVVGYLEEGGLVENCVNLSALASGVGARIGGVVGTMEANYIGNSTYATVRKCVNYADVIGKTHVGGVVGYGNDAQIFYCYNEGYVNATVDGAAGILGYTKNFTTILGCYNNGLVEAASNAYGICFTENRGTTVEDCFSNEAVCQAPILCDTGSPYTYDCGLFAEERFASGEVCYKLNSGVTDGTQPFYQTIGQGFPLFSGETVYYGTAEGAACTDEKVYSNDPAVLTNEPNHDFTYTDNGNGTHLGQCNKCTYYATMAHQTTAQDQNDGTHAQVCTFCGNISETRDHSYQNGFCADCDSYEEAELVDSVYRIDNAGKLYWFAALVNGSDASASAVLTKNITVNFDVVANAQTGTFRAWTPIGVEQPFTGTFDGQGFTVSGLYSSGELKNLGLVGDNSGTVQNVGVLDSYFYSSVNSANVGGVVGGNNGSVSGCYFAGAVSTSGPDVYMGGVVGYNGFEKTVENCYNTGSVTNYYEGSGTTTVGGVVGHNFAGIVKNCHSVGTVSNAGGSSTARVGSVIGCNFGFNYESLGWGSGTATAENCYGIYSELSPIGSTPNRNYATDTNVTDWSEDMFASGELTWQLNGQSAQGVWKQTIGTDAYPNFTGKTVQYSDSQGYYNEDVAVVELFDLAGANMKLGNDLTMYFYVNTSDLDGTGYYIELTKAYADGTISSATCQFADWEAYSSSMYRVGFSGIAAKEMCDEIKATVYASDGTQVSNTWTDSVRDYAIRMLNKNSSAKIRTLLADMLNYGAAAQQNFGYNTFDLANATMTATHRSYATQNFSMDAFSNEAVSGTGYIGSSLSLNTNICLTVYFDGSIVNDSMKAVVSYTDHDGNEQSYEIPGSRFVTVGSYKGVEINVLAAADAESLVTVEVYNGSTLVASASDSVESYAARKYESNSLLVDLMKFTTSAYAYFH